MLLNLAKLVNQPPQSRQLTLNKRVPGHIQTPCVIDCRYSVERFDTYYKLTLAIAGDLTVTCQRCLGTFSAHYANESQLALCQSDAIAEQLMSELECLVGDASQLDLYDIIVDELHLYGPEFHTDSTECDKSIGDYLNKAV